jgi:hypothetical protein
MLKSWRKVIYANVKVQVALNASEIESLSSTNNANADSHGHLHSYTCATTNRRDAHALKRVAVKYMNHVHLWVKESTSNEDTC